MTIYHGNKADVEIRQYLASTEGKVLGQLIMNLDETEDHLIKALKDWLIGLLGVTHGIHLIDEGLKQPKECPGCHLAIYEQAAIDGWCTDCNPNQGEGELNFEHVHDFTGPELGPVQCVGCGEIRHTTRKKANCKHMNVYENHEGGWNCLDCDEPAIDYRPAPVS